MQDVGFTSSIKKKKKEALLAGCGVHLVDQEEEERRLCLQGVETTTLNITGLRGIGNSSYILIIGKPPTCTCK